MEKRDRIFFSRVKIILLKYVIYVYKNYLPIRYLLATRYYIHKFRVNEMNIYLSKITVYFVSFLARYLHSCTTTFKYLNHLVTYGRIVVDLNLSVIIDAYVIFIQLYFLFTIFHIYENVVFQLEFFRNFHLVFFCMHKTCVYKRLINLVFCDIDLHNQIFRTQRLTNIYY